MNEPPGARLRVGLTGLTMAEYFRDEEGRDVLLFIDNIFRFTQAGSEVSALLGRMPSAVGYQPTLATEMGALQERITSTKKRLDHVAPGRSTCRPTTTPTRRRRRRSPTSTRRSARALDHRARHLPGRRPARLDLAHPRPARRRPGALRRARGDQRVLQRYRTCRTSSRSSASTSCPRRTSRRSRARAGSSASSPSRSSSPRCSPAGPASTCRSGHRRVASRRSSRARRHLPEQAFFLVGTIDDVRENAAQLSA